MGELYDIRFASEVTLKNMDRTADTKNATMHKLCIWII